MAEAADPHLLDIAWAFLGAGPIGQPFCLFGGKGQCCCEGGQSYLLLTPVPGISQVWLTQRRHVSPCCS